MELNARTCQNVAFALSLYVQLMLMGFLFSFMELIPTLIEEFDSDYATVGLIGTSAAATSYIVGHVSVFLAKKIALPLIIAISGAILAIAFEATSIGQGFWQLFITYSILFGIAAGVMFKSSQSLLQVVFNEHELNFATGMTNVLSVLGLIGFSCLVAYTVVISGELTWRELFQVYAAISLSIFLFGVLVSFFIPRVQPTEATETKQHMEEAVEESELQILLAFREHYIRNNKKLGFDALRDVKTDVRPMLLFVSNFITFMMELVPIYFCLVFIDTASNNINYEMFYYLPLVLGAGMMASRSIFAVCDVTAFVSAFTLQKVVLLGMIVVCAMFANTGPHETAAVLGLYAIYAALSAALHLLVPLRCKELLGSYGVVENTAVQYVGIGLGTLLGGGTCGGIYDAEYRFEWVFYACAVVFAVAFLLDELIFTEKSYLLYILSICGQQGSACA